MSGSLISVNGAAYLIDLCDPLAAGRTTTNEELEEMLEQGNSAVFTQGVSTMHIGQGRDSFRRR